jgi:hypothetical protein
MDSSGIVRLSRWREGRYEMIVLVRRIVVISVVVLALVTSGVVVALAASGGGSTPNSTTQAVAYARSVNLRAGDAPGTTGTKLTLLDRLLDRESAVTVPPPLGESIERCDGGPTEADVLVAMRSPGIRFAGPNKHREGESVTLTLFPIERVFSTVYVMRSQALASQDVAATATARARACIQTRAAELRHVTVSRLPVQIPGARAYGLRVSGIGEGPKAFHAPTHEDLLGFSIGPAEVVLTGVGIPNPVRLSTEQRLLLLLYRRASAHRL